MLYTTPNKNISSILGTSTDDIDTPKQGSDRILLVSVILLMIFGVLAVYSSIAFFAEVKHTTAGSLVVGHAVKVGIAFLAMLIVSKIDYHLLARFSRLGVVLSWILLVAVMLFGNEVFGAKRSLSIGGVSFQPASFAIPALLIHISVLLEQKQEYIKDFKRAFLPIMFWVIITCGLIGIEDFSTAALLFSLSLLVMFVGRISMMQLSTLILIGVMGAGVLIWQSPERQSRIDQYVDQVVEINSTKFNIEEGYQAQQAHIAIAQGELFGVGMGKSTQRNFLPAPYNDFIFAIIAEEYGLFGSGLVILIFTVILFRGIAKIAKNAPDIMGMLIAVGCTLTIVLYGFINAGVASGLLPVTGLPMPFVSYGGTNILFAGIMVGILMNISKYDSSKKAVFYA
ncbi:MAG: FtsW/RodA/SpoVE family cell cycle protein [Aliifodinibius sp.]|nr:FtsW/RodA/SpoVE family cell cycle protein [candidate division KSB1 bacterium]NIT60287.1 FtsW/RodA/SpoVE family cell cycle protein [Fodinibius sp.]NIV15023.1 FtsW/RodA/SpoVE family cell cycle protein [Fodinibius sp.]NIY28869.1 FtsW/RodA/SpoVE family cell cycle protein [Fodinibius sp.]